MPSNPYDPFYLICYNPLPDGTRTSGMDINPILTALRWGTTDPGGFNGANVGVRSISQPTSANGLQIPVDILPLGHVQIWTGNELTYLAYEGRIQTFNQPGGQQVTSFTAAGYGLDAPKDVWFYAPFDVVPLTAGQLLKRMVKDSVPLLTTGDGHTVIDPGGSFTAQQQSGRFPNQGIDQIVKAGDAQNAPITYLVYEDRLVLFRPRIAPRDDFGNYMPNYKMSFNPQTMDWTVDTSKLVGNVAVQYTPPGGTQATTPVKSDPFFSFRYGGVLKAALVTQSAMTEEQALQFRDSYLKRYSFPIITATITANESYPMLDRFGRAVPYYRIRAGEWILFDEGGQDLMLPITATDIDASSKTAKITATNV